MNTTDELLLSEVTLYLKKHSVDNNCNILIGFSGGPDSLTLLHLLVKLQGVFNFTLSALYLDHGIRQKDIMELECLRVLETAKTLKVPLKIINIPPGEIARESQRGKKSIEETAREYRYAAFNRIMVEKNFTHLALGHNLDDTIETLVMRFFQGSGIHGLTGIPHGGRKILRPLINVEKKQILKFVKENNLTPVIDETNSKSEYLRNKIRHILLPVAANVFPGYKKALLKLILKMEITEEYISSNMRPMLDKVGYDGTLRLTPFEFYNLSSFSRMELLYESWDLWDDKPFKQLPFKFIQELVDRSVPLKRGVALAGSNYALIAMEDRFVWKRLVVSQKKSYLRVISSGGCEIPSLGNLYVDLCSEVSREDTWLCSDFVAYPLVVRSREPGDIIDLAGGRKKIKNLFADWKVPVDERWQIPLVVDRNGILAVLGKPLGYRDRVSVTHKNSGSKCAGGKLKFTVRME